MYMKNQTCAVLFAPNEFLLRRYCLGFILYFYVCVCVRVCKGYPPGLGKKISVPQTDRKQTAV